MLSSKSPALRNHYLSSILPFDCEIIPQEQITKNRQFYRPEQFIWNNPHRTSKRMYPFYHKYNDRYMNNVKPKVDELEEQDKSNTENARIKKLSKIRNETRQRFYSRRKQRQHLQAKADGKKRKYSTIDAINYKKSQNSNANRLSSSVFSRSEQNMGVFDHSEREPKRGEVECDERLENLKALIREQREQNHSRIRMQFKKRKQTNQVLNSRVKKTSLALKSG